MIDTGVQDLCERGQELLMRMDYVEAEKALSEAERAAWDQRDFDSLARLYMPLQEARRQRRQRCGEGEVCLDLLAQGPHDAIDGRHVAENYPAGQLLVAGWGSTHAAADLRRLQRQHGLYVETFLGAVYPGDQGPLIAIVPLENQPLPEAVSRTREELQRQLPPHSLILRPADLPVGSRAGSHETYAMVMGMWERLHLPFLAAAEAQTDLLRKLAAYRRTIEVDYACELAHQHLADVARQLAREKRG